MNEDSPDRTVRLLALLDAARVHAGDVPGTRAAEQSLAALGNAARAWASVECPTCGRRGDHVWEELTGEEYYAHYTEGSVA